MKALRVSADMRDESHTGAKGGVRGVREVKDGWIGRFLCSHHDGLLQKMEGTHKSDEPVSKIT